MRKADGRIRPVSLRSLFRASSLYTIGNIAPKVGAFLLLPIYLRFLTQADYGSLALLTSLAGILAVVYHLGLDSALMRLHFDVEGRKRATLYSTATLFSIGLGAALTVLFAIGLGPFFESLFAGTPFIPLGGLALLVALVGSLQYVPSTLFRASGQAGRYLVVNLGAFFVSSAVAVVLIVVFGLGAAGVLTGQLIAGIAIFVVTIVTVTRLGHWSFNRTQLREALQLGLPLLPHGISAWALRLADRWLIALLIGLPAIEARSQVGIYAVGYQLGFIVSIVVTSFNAAWSPYFFRIGHRPAGPAFYTEMTTLVIGGLLVLAVGVSVTAPEIVAIIARPGYEAAADVLPVIAFASVFQGLYVMFVTVIFLTKRTGRLAVITFASAALNLALNLVLIPILGIMGAAWATLGSYAFFAATTYAFARRQYPMRVDWIRLTGLIGLAAVVTLAVRTISMDVSIFSGLVHIAAALTFTVVVVAVLWQPFQRLRVLSRALPRDEPTA
jgi:O-antigen/teichoic acid export membrane protein